MTWRNIAHYKLIESVKELYMQLEEKLDDQLLTETQAAETLNLSVYALRNWRVRGGGPKFVKISRRSVRYRRRDLHDWITSLLRSSTSE